MMPTLVMARDPSEQTTHHSTYYRASFGRSELTVAIENDLRLLLMGQIGERRMLDRCEAIAEAKAHASRGAALGIISVTLDDL